MRIGPVLGPDYHHRLSVAESASFCQRMPPGTIDFLEEPIRDESPNAYATLRTTDVPFAIGEEFSSKWQFAPYIEQGLTRVDICNVARCHESGRLVRHRPDAAQPAASRTAASVQRAPPWGLAGRPWRRPGRLVVRRNLPRAAWTAPGTPCPTPPAGAVIKIPVSHWESPHLTRPDSVTNW